jgi:hypothetical protein
VGRRTVVTLTALAVAVVLGVLAGMVVRLGGRVKDGATSQPEATFSATQTGFVPVDPSATPTTLAPAKGPNVAAPGSTASTSSPAPSSTGVAAPSTPEMTDSTPPTPETTDSTPPTPETSPSSLSTPTTISVQATTRTVPDQSSTSPSTVPAGPVAADEACAEFGARGDPEGTATLYCQHDDHDGTLRWRAVVAGGACLSKSMTGVDDLGVPYRCRAAGQHLNRWVRSR